jgi:hypothetical protein
MKLGDGKLYGVVCLGIILFDLGIMTRSNNLLISEFQVWYYRFMLKQGLGLSAR